MGLSETIAKVEAAVNLPVVLRIVGIFLLGITIWKGVHGFWPTAGILIGGAMLLVGGMFSKIYK